MDALERLEDEMHPDEEVLARFAEGRLTDAERETATRHLSTCDECTIVVAAVSNEAQGPARSMEIAFHVLRRRPSRRWIVPAMAAAVLMALAVTWLARRPATVAPPHVAHDEEPAPPTSDGRPPEHAPQPAPVPQPESPPPQAPNQPPAPTPEVSPQSLPPPPDEPSPAPPKPPSPPTKSRKTVSLANVHGPIEILGADGAIRTPAVACALRAGDRIRSGDVSAAFQVLGSSEVVMDPRTEVELGTDGPDLHVVVRRGRAIVAAREGAVAHTPEGASPASDAEFAKLRPPVVLVRAAGFDADDEGAVPVSGTRENGSLVGRAAKAGVAMPAAVWFRPALAGTQARATVRTGSRSIEIVIRTATNRAIRTTVTAPKDGRVEVALPAGESIQEIAFTPSVDTRGGRPWIEVDGLEVVGERTP